MIKLNLDNEEQLKKDFADLVLPKAANRCNYLLLALEHIDTLPASVPKGSESFGPITRDAINIIEGQVVTSGLNFTKSDYISSINKYKSVPNQVSSVNLTGLIQLLRTLLANNGALLRMLISCKPIKLLWLVKVIENRYSIGSTEKKLLKLAFDYDRFSEIANIIRTFFNTNNLVKICPYCNMEITKMLKAGTRKVSGHQLDHFYCKDDVPLLSYSLFNLVPSGEKCNGPNLKWKKIFTEEYHLNPYVSGFDDVIRFTPNVLHRKIIDIKIIPNPDADPARLMQLFGSGGMVNERSDEGNVNVFALQTRYNESIMAAQGILDCLHDANNGTASIAKYMRMIALVIDREKIHKKWYAKVIRTPFEPQNFASEMFSKFNRDLHDTYYLTDARRQNDFIRKMMQY